MKQSAHRALNWLKYAQLKELLERYGFAVPEDRLGR